MKTFGIDIDGVLRDFFGCCLDVYHRETGKTKNREECTDYELEKIFPDIPNATEWFLTGWRRDHILLNAKPIKDAVNAFNLLSDIGHTIIITHQVGFENQKITLQWLQKNDVMFDDICFLKDKSFVHKLDYFIDDCPYKFKGCEAKNGILIDAPYNRNVNLNELAKDTECMSIVRCNGLSDFVSRFTNIRR